MSDWDSRSYDFFEGDAVFVEELSWEHYYDTCECDVEIKCTCGNKFHIFSSNSYYQCKICGRIYQVRTVVELREAGRDAG